LIGEYDEIELPPVQPFVRRHRRFAICCEHCRAKTPAPLPAVTPQLNSKTGSALVRH
jgi:hypothetical protein